MSAERSELQPQRQRQDQFTRQQRAERRAAAATGVDRDDVATREIGKRPSVKEQALQARRQDSVRVGRSEGATKDDLFESLQQQTDTDLSREDVDTRVSADAADNTL